MKLSLDRGNNTTEEVFMGTLCSSHLLPELTLTQFYNFLRQMESAKASLESFS